MEPSAFRRPAAPRRASLCDGGKLRFRARAAADWCDAASAAGAAYVPLGRADAWRDADRTAAEDGRALDRDEARRAVASVRRRAGLGDARAQMVSFGPLRAGAVDARAGADSPRELLPPEVAAAMIEAGLNAMGYTEGPFDEG